MNELIWFSIPGAIALYALCLLFPTFGTAPEFILVGSVPVLGFIIHQVYRTYFEMFGGWESRRRQVINLIKNTYHLTSYRKAFLIWEITFYSDDIPEAFRSHNRSMWHYIMSFRSVFMTAFASFIATAFLPYYAGFAAPPNGIVVAFFLTAFIFWLKGRLTYCSLMDQEKAAFELYRQFFDNTSAALK